MSTRHLAVLRWIVMVAAVMGLAARSADAKTVALVLAKSDVVPDLVRRSIETTARSKPDVDLTIKDAEGNADRQVELLTALLGERVDAVIMMAVDGDQGVVMSALAHAAGVPLVFLNNPPINVEALPAGQAYVGSDETESGTLQAAEVCRLLDGKGRIAVLMGELLHHAARTRTTDIDEVLSRRDCAGIEIVERQSANGSRGQAQALVTEWLEAGAAFDAVIANNDEMALGAIEGLKAGAAWTDGMIVAGIDATGDGLAAVKSGDMQVTVLQNVEGQGRAALDAALKLASGERVPTKIYVPFELVTQTNVDAHLAAR